ncbi:MAG: hypothetical protein ABIK37_04545, partial [candidate division WOR-3 bacterium]
AMPFYAFLHPVLAVATLVWGIVIAQVSLQRMADWDFPLRRVRARTIVYFLLCAANFGAGLLFNALLSSRKLVLPAHLTLGIVVCVLALLALLATLVPGKPGHLPGLMRWHPVLTVASLALIITQGFLTALRLLRL